MYNGMDDVDPCPVQQSHSLLGSLRMRILIAERRADTRAALSALLAREPGVDVGGQARDSEELLAQVKTVGPELVVLEWGLPGQAAAELIRAVRAERAPGGCLKVVVLAIRDESREAALTAGADAFASKEDPPERLLSAIRDTQAEPVPRLELDSPAVYRIRVEGQVDVSGSEWLDDLAISREDGAVGGTVTTIYGEFAGQAPLLRLLEDLVGLGTTLLSIEYIPTEQEGKGGTSGI